MKNEKSPTKASDWLFVEIVWHDAISDSAWRTASHTHELAQITTRGWLIKKTRTAITVAATYGEQNDEEAEVNQILTIPRSWLASVTEVEIKPVRKISLRALK
jgi:hypothetical protein